MMTPIARDTVVGLYDARRGENRAHVMPPVRRLCVVDVLIARLAVGIQSCHYDMHLSQVDTR